MVPVALTLQEESLEVSVQVAVLHCKLQSGIMKRIGIVRGPFNAWKNTKGQMDRYIIF